MDNLPKEVLAEKEKIEKVIVVLNEAMNRAKNQLLD